MYIHDHMDIYMYSRSGMHRHGLSKQKHIHIYARIDEKQRSVSRIVRRHYETQLYTCTRTSTFMHGFQSLIPTDNGCVHVEIHRRQVHVCDGISTSILNIQLQQRLHPQTHLHLHQHLHHYVGGWIRRCRVPDQCFFSGISG